MVVGTHEMAAWTPSSARHPFRVASSRWIVETWPDGVVPCCPPCWPDWDMVPPEGEGRWGVIVHRPIMDPRDRSRKNRRGFRGRAQPDRRRPDRGRSAVVFGGL